ncbi:MAG: tetratricopeptide repeat protein [Proteobacteria bacterium]|nr:tetratricopeptide repeat protein [Pseudomonadota bacterium]
MNNEGPNPAPAQDLQALIQEAAGKHHSGNLAEAETLYRQILDADPGHADANHLLGVIHIQTGHPDQAFQRINQAIKANPGVADYHGNLGTALRGLGRPGDARAAYEATIALNPEHAQAHYNLGLILHEQGLLDEAAQRYRQAIKITPDYAEAYCNLGNVLRELSQGIEAMAAYGKAIAINPDFADAHNNLGSAYLDAEETEKAEKCYRRAIDLNPDYADAHYNLGSALKKLGRRGEAIKSYQHAVAIDPNFARAHNNLGSAHLELGHLDEALACYLKGMALTPGPSRISNNYFHALLYDPDLTNEDLFDTYRRIVNERHPGPASAAADVQTAPPDLRGKLRIGYLSSDFHDHPVGHNTLALIGNHDHAKIDIFCYAHETKEDAITGQFKSHADHWRPITGLTDEEIAAQIRDDGIHIMVYLGGHFDNNRPSVATRRPAPIQVNLFNGATTALDEMDYWITDCVVHPANSVTEKFTEELVPVSSFFVWRPPEDAPPVSSLPAEETGFITFASFNKPCKINNAVLDLWSEVLRAVPNSRLMLKYKDYFATPSLRDNVLGHFRAKAIAEDRIILINGDDIFRDHLACYAQADIGLDTFPFSGATTTFQALWMGVPVISLMTDRFIGRMGGALSTHVGLGNFAVDTPGEYVDQAAALAADIPRLKELRKTLRHRVADSPLCDGPGYAASVEQAFQDMWKARGAP